MLCRCDFDVADGIGRGGKEYQPVVFNLGQNIHIRDEHHLLPLFVGLMAQQLQQRSVDFWFAKFFGDDGTEFNLPVWEGI